MNLLRLTLSIGLGLAVACGPETDGADDRGVTERPAEARAGDAAVSTADGGDRVAALGAIRGVVRDARTDRPVPEALVSAGDFRTAADASGGYVLPPLPQGPVTVVAYRRGFRPDSVTAAVRAGGTSVVDLALAPAEPACCTLAGDWSGRFTLDSAGLDSRPAAREAEGRLSFEDTRDEGGEDADRVAAGSGSSELDFGPLLGIDIPGVVGEIEGVVFNDDSVAVTLLPRFGDWAIELRGRQAADTVRGSWFQRASCCGAYGSFVLVRDSGGRSGGRGS